MSSLSLPSVQLPPDTFVVVWMQNYFAVSKECSSVCLQWSNGGQMWYNCGKTSGETCGPEGGRVQSPGAEGVRVNVKSSRGFRANAPGNQFVRTCHQWTNRPPSVQRYFKANKSSKDLFASPIAQFCNKINNEYFGQRLVGLVGGSNGPNNSI